MPLTRDKPQNSPSNRMSPDTIMKSYTSKLRSKGNCRRSGHESLPSACVHVIRRLKENPKQSSCPVEIRPVRSRAEMTADTHSCFQGPVLGEERGGCELSLQDPYVHHKGEWRLMIRMVRDRIAKESSGPPTKFLTQNPTARCRAKTQTMMLIDKLPQINSLVGRTMPDAFIMRPFQRGPYTGKPNWSVKPCRWDRRY